MNSNQILNIDLARLEKVRRCGNKLTGRCPACASLGQDRTGTHFFMNADTGQFGCAAFPGDEPHRKEIFALVGIRGGQPRDPAKDRRFKLETAQRAHDAQRCALLASEAVNSLETLSGRFEWQFADVWEDSPQRLDCSLVESDPRHFLATLFPQDALVWCGEVFHSGTRHSHHWKTVRDWQEAPLSEVGPMVCPAVWKPGTSNRIASNILQTPFVVLDFDGDSRNPPTTPAEIAELHLKSLAVCRWLREALGWNLAAIVETGGKSLHCWFENPGVAALASLKSTAAALGVDCGLIGHAEHPCRLPGQRHSKSGQLSRVLWLQAPIP